MHTVEILDQALDLAKRCGFVVREDWFGGAPAGSCHFKGRHWLFIDLALSPAEKLDQVLAALGSLPTLPAEGIAPALTRLLERRKAA